MSSASSHARVVVITGVTRGLGRALALELARLGHLVLGCGRSTQGRDALREALPPPHEVDEVDVASDAQVAAWASRLVEAHGAPDLVLNNAALINRNAPLWEVPVSEFSDVVDVNIKGVANVIRHFAPAMIARGKGVIVNFSSGWGRAADAEVAPYCATKWAIEGLSRALAKELPAEVACMAVNPGIIDTDMLRSCFGEAAGGYPSAEQWARAAAPFLLGLGRRDNGRPLTAPGG